MPSQRIRPLVPILMALALLLPPALAAQEIEARTLANTPVDLNLIALAYGYSKGNVFLDPSLPIEDVNAKLHIGVVRYTRTFSLGGESAKVRVVLPFSSGHWEGLLEGEFGQRDASGIGDARFILDINVYGAPALTSREITSYRQRTIVGVSLLVVTPTGTYDRTKLINLGANRWGLRPQLGVSRAVGSWAFEGIAGVWLFTDNNDFLEGRHLSQDPLYVLKGDAVYTIRPGVWVGVGIGYGRGGTTTVDGVIRQTLQTNYRLGGTFAYALTAHHGISVSAASGVATRAGAEYDSFTVAYQYLWGPR